MLLLEKETKKKLSQCFAGFIRVREMSGKFKIFQGQGIVREFHNLSGNIEFLLKCQGILEFQMKFRFSNKKKRREILKMAVFFTVWVMLNNSDSFQILLSERKLKGLAPLVSSAAFCSRYLDDIVVCE